jgi:hypothetical protein
MTWCGLLVSRSQDLLREREQVTMCDVVYRPTIIISTRPVIQASSAASTGEFEADLAREISNCREAA